MTESSSTKFHLALAVSNIKNSIPIRLEQEKGPYAPWAELFKTHCRAYNVYEHIIPSKPLTEKEIEPDFEKELWTRLVVVVLTWIYDTISPELLIMILKPNSTATAQWNRLASMFLDNKNARASALENRFSNVFLDDFAEISSYCQELKDLADQLANVDAPVSNHLLVLRLINGLNDNYDIVFSNISQLDPLPDFFAARSRLILEETRKARPSEARTPSQAMVVQQTADGTHQPSNNSSTRTPQNKTQNNSSNRNQSSNRNKGKGRGRNNNGNNGGNGAKGSHHNGGRNQPSPQAWHKPSALLPWAVPWGQNWQYPPCPYPTNSWARTPPPFGQSGGILGSRPQQAYNTEFQPTGLEQAFQTMTLNPSDNN